MATIWKIMIYLAALSSLQKNKNKNKKQNFSHESSFHPNEAAKIEEDKHELSNKSENQGRWFNLENRMD